MKRDVSIHEIFNPGGPGTVSLPPCGVVDPPFWDGGATSLDLNNQAMFFMHVRRKRE